MENLNPLADVSGNLLSESEKIDMNNDKLIEAGNDIVKKKGKPRGGNNWLTDAALNLEPGDNTKYLELNIALFNMPEIDLEDNEAVQKRLSEYFALYASYDMKPTVAGMSIALNGRSRRWLWAITHDQPLGGRGNRTNLPLNVTHSIKKAYFLLENLWENYMQNGRINPVSGIFLGKNNFAYEDRTEYVVTPNVQQENDYNENDIRKRYLIEGGEDDGETD